MNHLLMSIEARPDTDGRTEHCVRLEVDGDSLLDIVRRAEAPFAGKLAGSYRGLPASAASLRALTPTRGQPRQTELLSCECGVMGCWDLCATLGSDGNTVTWSGFFQPQRGPDAAAGHWNYTGLGPFVFSQQRYQRELAKLKALLSGGI